MADAPKIFNNGDSFTANWDYKGYEYTQIINYSSVSYLGQNPTTLGMDSLTVYLPASALDYTYAGGAPAYYTKVTEYQMDMGSQTGKTVYKYYPRNHFFDDYRWTQIIPGTNIPYVKVNWHLGALESVAEYKYAKGKYQLRHMKKNEYSVFQKDARPRVAYSFPYSKQQVISGIYTDHLSKLYSFSSWQYNLSVGKLLLSIETEKWLENEGDTIIQTTNYYYDNSAYLQPSRIVKTHSSGSQTITLKYPYDETGVYLEMKTKNIISPVIQETIKDNMNGVEISKLRVNYRKDGAKFVLANVESSVQGGPLTEELRFDLYDQYENVLQTTSRNLAVKSFLWGYKGRYLVAEIENTHYTTASSLLDMYIVNNPSSENAIKTELEKLYQMSAMVNAYTYKPLAGIYRHISPQQKHTTYEYDTYGRLKTIYDNDQNIVKAFSYKILKSIPMHYYLAYTNIPRMESFNKNCGAGQMGIYNYVGMGGQQILYETDDPYPGQGASEGYAYDICAPASGFVKITFHASMTVGREVIFDFVKDGSIFATKTFTCYSVGQPANNLDFYLPVGEYSVVFRTGIHSYTEKPIKFYLDTSSGGGRWFASKDKVNFQSGLTYQIGVSNTH